MDFDMKHCFLKRIIKVLKWSILSILLLVVLTLVWLARPFPPSTKKGEVNYIAHAAGGIDGFIYTNSKEALLSSLENGFNFVELDLFLTTDSQLVCLHELENFNQMTGLNVSELDYRTFNKVKFYNKFTPLTFADAIKIWEEKKFVFVTDHFDDPSYLDKYFQHNRSNVYVEVRRFWNYHKVKNHGYHAMLTIPLDLIGLIKYFCGIVYGGRIDHIATSKLNAPAFLRIYKRLGTQISMFTENDLAKVDFYRIEGGVDMVYTDFIIPPVN